MATRLDGVIVVSSRGRLSGEPSARCRGALQDAQAAGTPQPAGRRSPPTPLLACFLSRHAAEKRHRDGRADGADGMAFEEVEMPIETGAGRAGRRTGRRARPDPFLRRAATAIGLAVLAVLLLGMIVLGVEVLLAAFAGVLGAVLLLVMRDFVARYTGLSSGWSLALVLVLLTGLIGGAAWLLIPQFVQQFEQLGEELPRALREAEQYLRQYAWGREVLAAAEEGVDTGSAMEWTQLTLSSFGAISTFLLVVIFVALFVAANPDVYRQGILRLVPLRSRHRAREVLDGLGETMRWWLMGQVLAMILIGVSVGILLAVLGVPFAAALGVIVGLLAFIPYLGPLVGAAPIALVALSLGPAMLVYTMVGYFVVQTIEGYVITPMIQHRMVYLPPALTIVVQVLLGALLGLIGFVLATPLAAVVMVLVKLTYVEGTLGDREEKGEGREGGGATAGA